MISIIRQPKVHSKVNHRFAANYLIEDCAGSHYSSAEPDYETLERSK